MTHIKLITSRCNVKISAFKHTVKYCTLTAFFYMFLSSTNAVSETKLTLNTGTAEPFVTADGGGFYGALVKELFSRININAKVIPLKAARAILNVNRGIDDGAIARTKGMEKNYTNLIRVPEPVVKFKFVAYSLDKKINITDWNSLKPYSVGIIRGWKIYEKKVVGIKELTKVTDAEQLFKLLLNNRSDLILFEYHRGTWWNKHLNAKAHLIGSPIVEKDMFIYMHKKHADLIPAITKALIELKKDGAYQKIKDKYLSAYSK